MKRFYFVPRFLAAALLFVLPSAVASALYDDAEDSRWELYTSFDTQPFRMIPTERYVFLLSGQDYQQENLDNGYGVPTGGLLLFDRQNPDAGFRDIRRSVTLHGAEMTHANYNPVSGVLVACYADGSLDLISAASDGSLAARFMPALRDEVLLKRHHINSVTFPVGSAEGWVATRGGFAGIDTQTGRELFRSMWDEDVQWICRIGDDVAAIIDGTLYVAPYADGVFLDRESYVPVDGGSPAGALMPLSVENGSGAFAFIGGSGNDLIRLAKKEASGKWNVTTVRTSAGLSDQWAPFRLATIYDNKCIPNRDGYFTFSAGTLFQIGRALNGDGTLDLRELPRPAWASPVYGTWDFEEFYFYPSRRTLGRRTITSSSASDPEYFREPDAPSAYHQTQFAWSPRHGMLVINAGPDRLFTGERGYTPMQLSALRDGRWHNLSPNQDIPAPCDGDATLTSAFNSRREFYPSRGPYGIAVDPVYPDWVLSGSRFNGLTAVDMSDRRAPAIRFVAPTDKTLAALPGHHPIFPEPSWDTNCHVLPGGFDADGDFWFLYMNMFSSPETPATLWRWSKEARAAMLGEKNPDSDAVPEPYAVVADHAGNIASQCLALRHERNRGLVLAYIHGGGTLIAILDTKNTPDTSDDEVRTFTHLRNEKAGREKINYMYSWAEDPVTGNVMIGTYWGLMSFDPHDTPTHGAMQMHPVGVARPDGTVNEIGVMSYVSAITFDEYGRLWYGTHTGGVTGLSADRRSIVAEYNTGNSPLPEDAVTGLGWDEGRHRLMIGTFNGICSVAPDLDAEPEEGVFTSETYIRPEYVEPDYAGNITVYNVQPESLLEIRDADGRWICNLPVAERGMSHWDLRDADGQRVAPGLYRLGDSCRRFRPIDIPVE